MLLFSAWKRQANLQMIAQHYAAQAAQASEASEAFRSRSYTGRKAEVARGLYPTTAFDEHMDNGQSDTTRRLSTQFDTFANGRQIIRRAAGAEGFANAQAGAARQLAGGLGAENFANAQVGAARQLAGGLGAENFVSDLPMLGGGRLTDGAIAMRAADPIMSEPPSPSERQYMKENELLEHLLYK
jgi:hypothetical protein